MRLWKIRKSPSALNAITNQKFVFFLKVALAVGATFYLTQHSGFEFDRLASFFRNWTVFAKLVMIGVVYDSLRGISFFYLFRSLGIQVSCLRCIQLQFIGQFLNLFLPGQGGALVGKGLYFSHITKSSIKSVSVVLLIDILLGLFALQAFGLFFMSLRYNAWSSNAVFRGAFAAFALSGVGSLLLVAYCFWRKLAHQSSNLGLIFSALSNGRTCIAVAALDLATYLMKCGSLYWAASYLEAPQNFDLITMCAGFGLGVVISMIPIAPGGLVSGHLGFKVSYDTLTGTSSAFGSNLYSVFWSVHLVLGLVGGVIFLAVKPVKYEPT